MGKSSRDIVREYKRYNHYVSQQVTRAKVMSDFKRTRVERLQSEFRSSQCLSEVGEHETDLCVGARFGEEVFVLREMGYLAVGIDLNPMMVNEFVLSGDEHRIEFPNGVLTRFSVTSSTIFSILKRPCRR